MQQQCSRADYSYLERAGNVVWYVKRPTSLWEGDKSTWFT